MTAVQLQHLPQTELGLVWLALRATTLPVGTFDGYVFQRPLWPAWWLLWKGKVFEGVTTFESPHASDTPFLSAMLTVEREHPFTVTDNLGDEWLTTAGHVRNRIGPLLLIPGNVSLKDGEVLIDYPQLHLQDRLKPVSETLWLGRMDLRGKTIWFTLEQAKG